jgi:poly(hydroxyalkanoate) depolymerase family esterase
MPNGVPRKRYQDMFDNLPTGLGETTKLIGAGHLMEATAAIQRALGGLPDKSAAADLPRGQQPPTLDGVAERPSTPSTMPAFRTRKRSPAFLGKVNLRDLVRVKARVPAASVTMPDGAQFLANTFANDAGSRPYKLYVPSGYRAGQEVPLVVMLHGCTQSPDDFAAGTRMNEIAEERTFLVVYPGQTGSANVQKCWNWFNEGDQRRGEGEPSLIAGITRKVMAEYAVDPKRVFVAGLSAGGAAAAIMGNAYPDLYAAIGVHSGLPCGAARDMPSAFNAMRQGAVGSVSGSRRRTIVPAIVFHGDRDTTVNLRNGDAVVAQSVGGNLLGSRVEEGQVPGGHSYARTIRADEAGRAVVEQWVIHGAPHAWAGGSSAGSYTDPCGPDATREMVRFFLETADA